MGSTPIDVFLTYDERDGDLARDVRRAVIGAGLSCWAEGVDLVPGELWDEVIPARIVAARVMAVLITPRWPEAGQRNADWYGPEKVALAIDQARSQGGRPMIVPVQMRGAGRDRVPYGIRRAAQLELVEDDLARLADTLKRAVARQAGQPVVETVETVIGVERDAARARQQGDAGERADVVVITALQVEYDALIAQSGLEWTRGTDPHGFPYDAADLDGLRIIAARTGGAGEQGATERAVRLYDHFDPQVLAICGICAGHPDDTRLGDVVVASRVFNFEHGAHFADGSFAPDQQSHELRRVWKIHAEELAGKPDQWLGALAADRPATLRWLDDHALLRLHETGRAERLPDVPVAVQRTMWQHLAARGWVEGSPPKVTITEAGVERAEEIEWAGGPEADPAMKARLGVMATGSALRRDPQVWAQVRALQRKTIAVEMESTAIGAVASQQKLDFLAVKGVSDHADADKDDRFHVFAARASAAFLLAFLRRHVEPRRRVAAPSPTPPDAAAKPGTGAGSWLDADAIERLVAAYIDYPLSRDLLLSWIDRGIIGRLKYEPSPAAQVRADLAALNALPAEGDDPPLVKWIEQAVRLAGPFPQARVYREVLAALRAEIAARA